MEDCCLSPFEIQQALFNVYSSKALPLFETANALSKESVVSLTGVLKQRVSGTINPNLELGAFEIEYTDIKIYSIAQMLPFDQQQTINDEQVKISIFVSQA